jgi:hypothetical protein
MSVWWHSDSRRMVAGLVARLGARGGGGGHSAIGYVDRARVRFRASDILVAELDDYPEVRGSSLC